MIGKLLRKLVLVSSGCLFATAAIAGACRGEPCRYILFDKDKEGCLEIRNTSRQDIQITVYTAGSGTLRLRVAKGDSEKLYKTGRICVPAADYVRADAEYEGDIFAPSR